MIADGGRLIDAIAPAERRPESAGSAGSTPDANSDSSSAARTVDESSDDSIACARSASLKRSRIDGISSTARRSSTGACSHQTAIGSVSWVPDVATASLGYSRGSRNGWPGECQ